MRFFLHHRRFGILTSVECATDNMARRLGAKMPMSVPYVVEVRYNGISEYQGFGGITEHYEFVQSDAKTFGK